MEKLNITPDDIAEKEFSVAFQGYSADEVDDLMTNEEVSSTSPATIRRYSYRRYVRRGRFNSNRTVITAVRLSCHWRYDVSLGRSHSGAAFCEACA